jgi:hypothetical protein
MGIETGQQRKRRRGVPVQRGRRALERTIRRSAVAYARWARSRGLSVAEAADRLTMAPSTLRSWLGRWQEDRMALRLRGRPLDRAEREERVAVLALFGLMGPGLGLPTLMDLFPDVARRELEELQCRYRHVYRRKNCLLLHVLRWTRAGAVWAVDFAEPPRPIDGVYDRVFVVRDLASGYQLLALPAAGESGDLVRQSLHGLFAWQGAPLVLKSDNGAPFVCATVLEFLTQWSVLQLRSPEGTPAYNGSVEAGIGSLKTRAHYEAARHDRLWEWTCDDLDAARDQANETARPHGTAGPTPAQAWHARVPVSDEERAAFRSSYTKHVERERLERRIQEPNQRQRASIDRVAIGRTLIESDLLLVRRRRVSPPFIRRKWAKIS